MLCNYCERRCKLVEGSSGACGMYTVRGEDIVERFPQRWCFYSAARIESFPFYHVYPGSRALSVGTFGCNFRCSYCSNGYIALAPPDEFRDRMFHLSPRKLVRTARKMGCRSIIFNINEPTVSLPTLEELRSEAEKAGMPLGCFTNGYGTREATDMLASIFSFINFGLKGFSDAVYRKYMGIPSLTPILRNLSRLAGMCHLEVITPVIQGENDHQLDEMASFLADIDRRIPWHVFRLLPEHDMRDTEYPCIDDINKSLETARGKLDHIYFHNFVGSEWVNTNCPECGSLMIERFSLGCGGDRLNALHCPDGRCRQCGSRVPLLTETPSPRTRWYPYGYGTRGCPSVAESA